MRPWTHTVSSCHCWLPASHRAVCRAANAASLPHPEQLLQSEFARCLVHLCAAQICVWAQQPAQADKWDLRTKCDVRARNGSFSVCSVMHSVHRTSPILFKGTHCTAPAWEALPQSDVLRGIGMHLQEELLAAPTTDRSPVVALQRCW